MSRIILFDIDNTLLFTGGAGTVAMNAAFRDMFGIEDGFARVEFSGRTDRYIFLEGLRQHSIDGDQETQLEEFTRRYYALLPQALREREGRLMPGFPQLLEALDRERGVRLGLATGNFSGGACLKLDYYGLAGFFPAGGGFGEDSDDRSRVVALAIERVSNGARPSDVLIVGDTPLDVASALDNGATAVGVATGRYSVEELKDSGAHLAFEDLGEWERAAAILSGRA